MTKLIVKGNIFTICSENWGIHLVIDGYESTIHGLKFKSSREARQFLEKLINTINIIENTSNEK